MDPKLMHLDHPARTTPPLASNPQPATSPVHRPQKKFEKVVDGNHSVSIVKVSQAMTPAEKQKEKTMKTQFTLTNETEINSYAPVEGVWEINTNASEDRDAIAAAEEIAAAVKAKHGFAVKVELFHEDGRAIVDECPFSGSLLVTRE
jgi:alpha-L-arabinofuranosidase